MAYGKNQWYYLYNISYVSYTAYKINDIIIDKISVLRILILKGMRARDQPAYLTPKIYIIRPKPGPVAKNATPRPSGWESNPRPLDYKTGALPLSYRSRCRQLRRESGEV